MHTLFYWSIINLVINRIIICKTYPIFWIDMSKFDFINLSNMSSILIEELILRIPLLFLSDYFLFDIRYSALIFSLSHVGNYSTARMIGTIHKLLMLILHCTFTFYLFLFLSEFNTLNGILIHYIYDITVMILFHLLGRIYIFCILGKIGWKGCLN